MKKEVSNADKREKTESERSGSVFVVSTGIQGGLSTEPVIRALPSSQLQQPPSEQTRSGELDNVIWSKIDRQFFDFVTLSYFA
ncbi:hypothetical protein ONZ45_g14404 [Pleurotus djamor]|nr:hypothetical protein ONZ45_g14404 [Pleurotus djamor]